MDIVFHGAAGEVTGSCHLVEVAGKRVLLDCGMVQGDRKADERNAADFPFDPKAIDVLRGFTPPGAANIVPAAEYLNFVLKFIVAFGVAFLLPVFIVGLNLAGLVSAAMLRKAWRGAVMGIMVFAAVITPTVDPYSMFLIGAPMVALYFLAMGVCAVMDRRRRKKDPSWLGTPDDEASSIDDLAEPLDP